MLDQFYLSGPVLYGAIQRLADSWKNSPGTVNDVLDRLERTGMVETARTQPLLDRDRVGLYREHLASEGNHTTRRSSR